MTFIVLYLYFAGVLLHMMLLSDEIKGRSRAEKMVAIFFCLWWWALVPYSLVVAAMEMIGGKST
jgi:hypothetical protein